MICCVYTLIHISIYWSLCIFPLPVICRTDEEEFLSVHPHSRFLRFKMLSEDLVLFKRKKKKSDWQLLLREQSPDGHVNICPRVYL